MFQGCGIKPVLVYCQQYLQNMIPISTNDPLAIEEVPQRNSTKTKSRSITAIYGMGFYVRRLCGIKCRRH